MTDWSAGNDAYLAAALAWLRLRLEWLAEQHSPPPPPAPTPPPPESRGLFGWRTAPSRPALPAPARIGPEALSAALAAMHEAETDLTPPPALRLLGGSLGLSPFERQVLLLCAAMELDTGTAARCEAAHGRPFPTFALALALFENPAWDVLSPERPLRYWRLLEIHQPAAQPLTTAPLRADERVVAALKGLHYLDDRLAPLVAPLPAPGGPLPPSQQAVVQRAVQYLQHSKDRPRWPLVELVGSDPASLTGTARHIAAALGLPLYQMPTDLIPTGSSDSETLARLWQRESLLSPLALYLDTLDLDAPSPQHAALLRLLARTDGIVLLGTREVRPDLGREVLLLDVARPTPAEQRLAWRQALGDTAGDAPEALSAQFDLGLEAIQTVAEAEQSGSGEATEAPLASRLWDACRALARPRLETLAQSIAVKADWSRLVLPDAELHLLHQIADQVRARAMVYETWGFAASMNRGLGISALFAGESGTGKTMAAEVLAGALRLDLYRIDLASVVSKYIGETEKNLRRLFDAAESGGAILFFDEADALFGKRSEVKDAHDRYANIEINYLLQRMEQYRGLAILATNMKSALDAAFVRRLRFIVNFPFPGSPERQRMWQRAFPAAARLGDLDYVRLARLNLSGAGIQNAALNAAFLAAHADTSIGMPEVLEAARAEFRKLERPVNEADFRWDQPEVKA